MTQRTFAKHVARLAEADPDLAAIVSAHGAPRIWQRPPGFATLVLLILEQQVSLASARAAFDRLAARIGGVAPAGVLLLDDATLREVGFSRQKTRYARALARAVLDGDLDVDGLAALSDDDARTALTALPGIGAWTADVYLLACLGRPDVLPIGDIALQAAAQRAKRLAVRPTPAELEALAEPWRPVRAVAAQLLWHLYLSERGRG
jgi:DNA-3-methyladenine glycosylase II